MEYRILGPFTVQDEDRDLVLGGLRQRAVLAVLVLAGDRTVEVDRLIEQVWGDDPPPKPLASLRAYVTNLRRILGADGVLVREANGYRLDTADDVVDIREFSRLVTDGRRLLDVGDAAGAKAAFDDAQRHWRGTPLTDFRNLSFTIPEIHRLETMRADAVESRFEAAARLGAAADLVGDVESEILINPLREKLWWQLMLAMYRSGRRTDALRAYERARDVLDTELGVTPGVALQRLATDIRNESSALDWQPPVAITGAARSPEPREVFYGRLSEAHRLRDALDAAVPPRGTVTVVTGESGMGKTALAHHVAEMADEAGMATAWAGHASEVQRPPSWAWAHAVRELAGQLRSGAEAFHKPLPEWWAVATEDANAGNAGADPGFDVAEATTAALAELVSRRPALIVLDDLQRADRFTCDALEHLASTGGRLPLVVLATWQDGIGADRTLSVDAFDRLRSRTDIDFIKLRGLSHEATATLIADVCGAEPQPAFTASVQERTGGNPFYIRELVRLLADTDRLGNLVDAIDCDDVPEAVSGVIRRRMAALPHSSRTALGVAAVSGADFLVSRLAAVTGSTIADTEASLSVAQRAGLIVEVSAQPACFGFSHGLVRDAIAVDISGVQRARLHADLARGYAADSGDVASQDAMDGAHHAWEAGSELEAPTTLRLLNRARTDAWTRSAYREVADLDRRALDVCSRLPSGPVRFDLEIDLQLQLASVEAVVTGQSSAKVLERLRHSSDSGEDAIQSTASVCMGCLEACGTGRYHDATVLSDSLIDYFAATAEPIAGSAGYYIRALSEFMRGNLDLALTSVATLSSTVPSVNWTQYGALASFEVLAYGVAAHAHALRGNAEGAHAALTTGLAMGTERNDAFGTVVLRTAEIQLGAMLGDADGLACRAQQVVAELTELGIDQFIGGARLIHGWALAMGADRLDTVDEMHSALDLHGQGGRRIFSPLYYGLLSDATALHRDLRGAQGLLSQAESIAAATGERVWDAQLSARRLRLVARQKKQPGGMSSVHAM